MADSRHKSPSTLWLVAAHGLLSLTALVLHVSRYPVQHSLFYWWIAPFDAAALLLVTPLYFRSAMAPLGFCLNFIISGLEATALLYLGILNLEPPLTMAGTGVAAINGALLVAARIPLGWYLAATARKMKMETGGCAP